MPKSHPSHMIGGIDRREREERKSEGCSNLCEIQRFKTSLKAGTSFWSLRPHGLTQPESTRVPKHDRLWKQRHGRVLALWK